MRLLLLTLLTLVCAHPGMAGEVPFSKFVKASLVFHDDFDATRRYPHVLKVFLRIDNAHDSSISWVANSVSGLEVELLDATNTPVPDTPNAASIQSGWSAYFLPYGSRLDWLVSHGGVSMMGEAKESYALIIGGHGWLVPVATAGSYTLRIRLHGQPWTRSTDGADTRAAKLLLDLPPTKVEVTP